MFRVFYVNEESSNLALKLNQDIVFFFSCTLLTSQACLSAFSCLSEANVSDDVMSETVPRLDNK